MAGEPSASHNIIFLFDVDGTLTPSRLNISPELEEFLNDVKKKVHVGLVGGSDFAKIDEQMNGNVIRKFEYVFTQNGLVSYRDGELFHNQSFLVHLGEEKMQRLINFCLRYIADLKIPQKRGTFIEFRHGMLNVSPIGRNCSYEERLAFLELDKKENIRKQFIDALQAEFFNMELSFSIGGQISIDIFPKGWDKTYCLKLLSDRGFSEIHFFGDKTSPGGNDYEIFSDARTIGHTVSSPDDTKRQIQELIAKIA